MKCNVRIYSETKGTGFQCRIEQEKRAAAFDYIFNKLADMIRDDKAACWKLQTRSNNVEWHNA